MCEIHAAYRSVPHGTSSLPAGMKSCQAKQLSAARPYWAAVHWFGEHIFLCLHKTQIVHPLCLAVDEGALRVSSSQHPCVYLCICVCAHMLLCVSVCVLVRESLLGVVGKDQERVSLSLAILGYSVLGAKAAD